MARAALQKPVGLSLTHDLGGGDPAAAISGGGGDDGDGDESGAGSAAAVALPGSVVAAAMACNGVAPEADTAADTGAAAAAAIAATHAAAQLLKGGPAPTASRVGRALSRYGAGGERLLAGCIPARLKQQQLPHGSTAAPELSLSSASSADDVEVLMITSRGGAGMVFPKGGWEADESVEGAALRETVEEAGVRGVIEPPMIGVFRFPSKKGSSNGGGGGGGNAGDAAASGAAGAPSADSGGADSGAGAGARDQGRRHDWCSARMFVVRVEEELPDWPEAAVRRRRWMSLEEARHCCRYPWMKDALLAWARARGWDLETPAGAEATTGEAGAKATVAAAPAPAPAGPEAAAPSPLAP